MVSFKNKYRWEDEKGDAVYRFKRQEDLTDKEKQMISKSQNHDFIISRESTGIFRAFYYRGGDFEKASNKTLTYIGLKPNLEKTIEQYRDIFKERFKPVIAMKPETERHFGGIIDEGYKNNIEKDDKVLIMNFKREYKAGHTYKIKDYKDLTEEEIAEIKSMERIHDPFPFVIYKRKLYPETSPVNLQKKVVVIGDPLRVEEMLTRHKTNLGGNLREEIPMKSKTKEHFSDIVEKVILENKEEWEWVLFIVYDYQSPRRGTPAHVRYKLTPLKGLDKKWKDILDGMNEDVWHQTLGNKKDKEIRNFNQPIEDGEYLNKKQAIVANISSKENLEEIINTASDGDWTEIVDLKPETKKHFDDIVGMI